MHADSYCGKGATTVVITVSIQQQGRSKRRQKPVDVYFSQCERSQDLNLFLQVLNIFTLEGLFTVESQWHVCAAANAPAAFCVPLATFFTM